MAKVDLRVLVDRSLIEVWALEGQVFAQAGLYTADPVRNTAVHLYSDNTAPVQVDSFRVWTMGCGWSKELPTLR